jgi:hypothetical protein
MLCGATGMVHTRPGKLWKPLKSRRGKLWKPLESRRNRFPACPVPGFASPPDGQHAPVAAAGALREDVHPLAGRQARLRGGEGRQGRHVHVRRGQITTLKANHRGFCTCSCSAPRDQPQASTAATHLRNAHAVLGQPPATLHRKDLGGAEKGRQRG